MEEFINWLYKANLVTSTSDQRYYDGLCRIDFSGKFTEVGLEFFNMNEFINPGPNWGSEPMNYSVPFTKVDGYEIVDITQIENRADVTYEKKYSWMDIDYVTDIKDKLNNINLKDNQLSKITVIKSDNKGWIKY